MLSFICELLLAFNINVSCNVSADTTPMTQTQVWSVLENTYEGVTGKKPTPRTIAMATAHVSLENGRGAKTVRYNLGNIGAAEKATSGHQWYKVGPGKFLAQASAIDGARTYWKHMVSKCPQTLKRFELADAMTTARDLHSCGYHRADIQDYGRTMGSLYNEDLGKGGFAHSIIGLF